MKSDKATKRTDISLVQDDVGPGKNNSLNNS